MERKTRKLIEKRLRQYKSKENIQWNKIINNNLNKLNDIEKQLIELRYFEGKTINYVTYELYMSRCKYFDTVDNILTEIALDAAYYHLIKR